MGGDPRKNTLRGMKASGGGGPGGGGGFDGRGWACRGTAPRGKKASGGGGPCGGGGFRDRDRARLRAARWARAKKSPWVLQQPRGCKQRVGG